MKLRGIDLGISVGYFVAAILLPWHLRGRAHGPFGDWQVCLMGTGTVSIALGTFLFANIAWAEPSPIPIQVNAHLAQGCPTASDFALSLIRRSHRLRLASPGEAAIGFDIAASVVPSGYIGQLQIRELDGRLTQRLVEGTNCSEIVNAFAFVAAVLVDPEAAATIEKPTPPVPPPVENSPAVVEAVPSNVPARARALQLGFGVAFGTNSAATPTVSPNFGLRLTGATQRLVFPFWVAVGADYRVASTKTVDLSSTTKGEASIGGWTSYLLASPIDWQPADRLHVRPMVQMELGQISAPTVTPSNGLGHSRTWFALGAGANAEVQFARPMFAFAEAGLIYPLYQPSFYFLAAGGEVTVHNADKLGWNARLGLALHFW